MGTAQWHAHSLRSGASLAGCSCCPSHLDGEGQACGPRGQLLESVKERGSGCRQGASGSDGLPVRMALRPPRDVDRKGAHYDIVPPRHDPAQGLRCETNGRSYSCDRNDCRDARTRGGNVGDLRQSEAETICVCVCVCVCACEVSE